MAPSGSSQRLDRIALLLLAILAVTFGLVKAAAVPLWSDELATLHLAAAPNWHQMITWSHTVDLNPPLEPSLARISVAVFGPHEFGVRVPSVLAFAAGVCATFLFLRRHMRTSFAIFGALLCLCSPEVSYYLTEARPYALLFAGASVAVLAYDSILSGAKLRRNRVLLSVALLCILQSHLFGVLAAGAFVLAELLRTVQSRRFDTATWAAILLPFLSCVTYLPILHSQSAPNTMPMIYEERDRTALLKGLEFYHSFLYLPLAPLIKVLAIVLLCTPFFPSGSPEKVLRLGTPLWVLLLTLLATPVLVAVVFHFRAPQSGFFPRYSIVAIIPAFALLASIAAWRSGQARAVGWMLALAAFASVLVTFRDFPRFAQDALKEGVSAPPSFATNTAGMDTFCQSLPLVVNNALDFFEDDYRVGRRLETRMVYVTDVGQSLALEHETALESVAEMGSAFKIPHQVVPSRAFFAAHRRFLVLSRVRHNDWFLDFVHTKHAEIIDLGPIRFAGNNNHLWFVSLETNEPPPACLAARLPHNT